MDPQLWKQVDALLEEALDQPPEKRETFVAEACKGNPVLRDEVLSLLNAQSRAGEFMEGSAMSVAVGALAQKLTTTASLAGKELGPYKVEKLLGAGGMGEVYLARDTNSIAWSRSRSCRGIFSPTRIDSHASSAKHARFPR